MISLVIHLIYQKYQYIFIEVYVLLLLNYIRHYFAEQLTPEAAAKELHKADLKLLSRFQTLIEVSFHSDEVPAEDINLQSVGYYAEQLNVHPNHLNAVVKSISGRTALQLIHHHVILNLVYFF